MKDLWVIKEQGDEALLDEIRELLGKDADALLGEATMAVPKSLLTLPKPLGELSGARAISHSSPDESLSELFRTGNLKETGHLSIFPVDQGAEHGGGASFATNPAYFDPGNLVKLAMEGGCNGIAAPFGVLRKARGDAADKLPFIVKLNHADLLNSPVPDQVLWASVAQAHDIGAKGVGLTIYYGSGEYARRQITEAQAVIAEAHSTGLFVVIWAYVRNKAFKIKIGEGDDKKDVNFEVAADLTGDAVHQAAMIGADIIKQKLPEHNLPGMEHCVWPDTNQKVGKFDPKAQELIGGTEIDWARWQVLNAFAGKTPLINSGGDSGANDLAAVVCAAVINKRAGGTGLITGRKAFKRPMDEGIKILHAVQAVYACPLIQVA